MTDKRSWNLEEGEEIVPGRTALQVMGGGHRYEAYLAWDEEMHTIVVAKLLRPDVAQDEHALRGLQKEYDITQRLEHPVLMRSFGIVSDGERPHLVLEHLEGGRLSTLLRRQKRLAIEQVIPLGMQLTSALIYMHNQGIVHLDVKPKNIIMGAPPRLIDLSIARTFEAAARAVDPIGTDAYMAPEQCDPKLVGAMGPASDVWGWGVTMYEAITGALPFPKVDKEGAYPQLHLEPTPFGKEAPKMLAELVMSTLERRFENRPTQKEVAEALEPFSEALPKKIVLSRLRPRIG